MAKIMLVEDDNNLREIYEARLLAEGYEIVSAHDGEEALALAVKEKPDLIISDVMMPKISGFDMLDILRTTPETKDTKVIMMTALSQAEDKSRADKLGADRYLVKSQVTLEDVAKIAREVLDGTPPSASPSIAQAPTDTPAAAPAVPAPEPAAAAPAPEPVAAPAPAPDPTPTPVVDTPVVAPPADPVPTPPATPPADPAPTTPAPTPDEVTNAQSASSEQAAVDAQINNFVTSSSPAPEPPATPPADPAPAPEPVATSSSDSPAVTIGGKKVLHPINDPTVKPDLNKLLEEEEKKSQAVPTVISPTTPPPPPTAQDGDPNLIAL